jgi:nucleotide-binding universal stress UspA family protein
MRDIPAPSPSIVVGIDGSSQAITAALWAIEEAFDRDVPLRLVYAIQPRGSGRDDGESIARDFATAEIAVRQAVIAIEADDHPVKIEVEIVQDRPVAALLAASHSAAMICIGAHGSNEATGKRVGSTVSGLLAQALCPVAIVTPERQDQVEPGCVVTEFENSTDGPTALGHALEEARLRKAPLRVLATWRPGFPDIQDAHARAEGGRQAKADLERSLTRYRRQYPDVDIHAVAVPCNTMNYLAQHADSIQLLVLGHHPSNELTALTGPTSYSSLNGLDCSLLISEPCGAL